MPKNTFYKLKLFMAFLSLFLCCSCSISLSRKTKPSFLTLKESYCNPSAYAALPKNTISKNTDSVLAINQYLKPHFSTQSILILNALNLSEDVLFLLKNKKDSTISTIIKKLQVKTEINTKILLALTDISSLSAEFDCEGERLDQVANYVDNINSTKNNRLIVGSILIGAAASVASGFIKNDNFSNGVSIGSGVVAGGLGFLTLNPKGKKVNFFHKKNLLRDVWQETNTLQNFPHFVWYMLSEKHFSNGGIHALLATEKQRWIEYQFNSDEKAGNNSVIFSDGGVYRASDLHSRAQMVNQMQSAVRSINQHLSHLLKEIETAFLL